MLSSEVSVLTLMFISLERYFIIVYPYSFQRIKARRAVIVLIFIWIIGTILAVLPIIPVAYFGNFYGSNGVCFPLHLHEPKMKGWEYSAFVFLGINTTAFIVIVVSYTGMFVSIRRTRRAAAQCGMKGDMAYAKRFFFIILTDSLCWLPIAILKVVSLCDFVISETLYGWIVVFVLPINSALNPILYTISTTPFVMWFLRSIKRGRSDSSDGFTSYTNLPKRASCFSTGTNGPLGLQLEGVSSVSTCLPSVSATMMTTPLNVIDELASGETSPSLNRVKRLSTPIVSLDDLME
nr:relaxin receptor 1-like [Lytechinus pictus]